MLLGFLIPKVMNLVCELQRSNEMNVQLSGRKLHQNF